MKKVVGRRLTRSLILASGLVAVLPGAAGLAETQTTLAVLNTNNQLLLLDVQSQPGTATLVRNLTDTLPVGWVMGGTRTLARAADGYLYTITRLTPQGASENEYVMQWSDSGYVDSWVGPFSIDNGAEGFGVTADGNFLVADRDRPDPPQPYVREYSRADPTQFKTYSYTSSNVQGDDGLAVLGNTLYVAGNHYVAIYDIPAGTQTATVITATDNSDVAVAADQRMAVNQQWFDGNPGEIAFVQVFAADGTEIDRVQMPEYYSAHDVTFDENYLGVLSWNRAGGEDSDPVLRLFDEDLKPGAVVSLDGFGQIYDVEFVALVPEPSTLITCRVDRPRRDGARSHGSTAPQASPERLMAPIRERHPLRWCST